MSPLTLLNADRFSTIVIPEDDDDIRRAFGTLQTWGARLRELIRQDQWSPVDKSGAMLSFVRNTPNLYCRIGPLVWFSLDITYPTTADTSTAKIGGLPFQNDNAPAGLALGYTTYTTATTYLIDTNGRTISPYKLAGGQPTNANLSTLVIRASGFYQTQDS